MFIDLRKEAQSKFKYLKIYNEIKYYKGYLIQKGKYDKVIKQITVSEQVVGHFMFADSEFTILKKFESCFGGTMENFNLKPKDLRETCFNEKNNWYNEDKEEFIIDIFGQEQYSNKSKHLKINSNYSKKQKIQRRKNNLID